jgi:hypothetical protein
MKVCVTVKGDSRVQLCGRAERALDKLSGAWRNRFADPRRAVDEHITATLTPVHNGYVEVASWTGELAINI